MNWTQPYLNASKCLGRTFEMWAIQWEGSQTWEALYLDSSGGHWQQDGYHTQAEAQHAAETRLFAAIEVTLSR